MNKFIEIIKNLFEIKSYACFIKTKNSDQFLVIDSVDNLLTWYKSESFDPFIVETEEEVTRLEKKDILSIRQQPLTELRRRVQPVLYAMTGGYEVNLVKSTFKILILAAAGFWGWNVLNGQSVTITSMMNWLNMVLSFLSASLSFLFIGLGIMAGLKASKNKAITYWAKNDFTSSIVFQAFAIGFIFMLLPYIMNSLSTNHL